MKGFNRSREKWKQRSEFFHFTSFACKFDKQKSQILPRIWTWISESSSKEVLCLLGPYRFSIWTRSVIVCKKESIRGSLFFCAWHLHLHEAWWDSVVRCPTIQLGSESTQSAANNPSKWANFHHAARKSVAFFRSLKWVAYVVFQCLGIYRISALMKCLVEMANYSDPENK